MYLNAAHSFFHQQRALCRLPRNSAKRGAEGWECRSDRGGLQFAPITGRSSSNWSVYNLLEMLLIIETASLNEREPRDLHKSDASDF